MKRRPKPKDPTLDELIDAYAADLAAAQRAKERALAWIKRHRRWQEPPAVN